MYRLRKIYIDYLSTAIYRYYIDNRSYRPSPTQYIETLKRTLIGLFWQEADDTAINMLAPFSMIACHSSQQGKLQLLKTQLELALLAYVGNIDQIIAI